MSGIRFSSDLEAMRQRIAELEGEISVHQRGEELQAAQLRLIEFADEHTVIELLQNFLDEAEKLTGSEIGFYHFVGADQKTLVLQTWSTNTLAHACNAEGAGLHYPIEDAGVWVECVHVRKPVVHNDYASLPHKKGLPEGHALVVRELIVPVLRGEKIVAILGVGNKPTDYGEYDISVIQRLAVLAWETIDRKQVENALQESEARHRDQLEKLVAERTHQLQERMNEQRQILSLMAGREVRMSELKKAIKKLRKQLKDAGLEPIANDPLLERDIP